MRAASTATRTATQRCSNPCGPSVHDGARSSPRPGATSARGPAPATWSALEYAAHSRDITALHVFGVEQALTRDEPTFPAIGDDLLDSAAAAYCDADPVAVVDALTVEADRLAQLAEDAGTDRWARGLTVGEQRSDVRRLLEHALHDSLHHLDDVERGLQEQHS